MASPLIEPRDAALAWDIRQAITRFAVHLHYVESAGGPRRYAVFDRASGAARQVSDPLPHGEAQAECRDRRRVAIAAALVWSFALPLAVYAIWDFAA